MGRWLLEGGDLAWYWWAEGLYLEIGDARLNLDNQTKVITEKPRWTIPS
jgi:hypothetical protein